VTPPGCDVGQRKHEAAQAVSVESGVAIDLGRQARTPRLQCQPGPPWAAIPPRDRGHVSEREPPARAVSVPGVSATVVSGVRGRIITHHDFQPD
jgi:hypothetical protein